MKALFALNPPIEDWRGKRVWLIGASSGIGLALAKQLHAKGAQVIVSARQQHLLATFVLQHPGSRAMALDVTQCHAVLQAANALMAEGPLDFVCYCAAHYAPVRADSMNLEDMLRHQQVNWTGVLYLLAAVVPGLLDSARDGRSPHLSLVASVAGWRGLPQSLAYGPTKAALINLAENLYLDLRPKGVGVSVVSPGFVDTPLTRQNRFTMPALLTPEQAAQAMLKGWAKGQFELHFPRRFTGWLKVLRVLPHRLYFALVHRMTGL